MRLTIKYLTLFLLCTFFTCAQAESFKLSYETISASEIEKNPKYQMLHQFDPGHHKTIIRIHGLPNYENYILQKETPLFGAIEEKECPAQAFMVLKNALKEDLPLICMSSRGFLPGERIILTLTTQDKTSISEKVEFIPHPIVLEAPKGGAKIKAELVNLRPAYYAIQLEGFNTSEKIHLKSLSSGEEMNNDFFYTKELGFSYSPDVIGKEGGVCDLTLTRQNGEKFRLHLPWGEEFLGYSKGDKGPIILEFTQISSKVEN